MDLFSDRKEGDIKWREKGNDGFAHWENVMLSLSSVTQRSLAVCGPEIPHKSLVPYFLGSETGEEKSLASIPD